MTNIEGSRTRKAGTVGLASLVVLTGLVTAAPEASAQPHGGFHGGGAVFRPHGGGFGGHRFGGGHHRGLGVGAAVGLGILGAAAAGVATSQYYNGYPAYSDGTHPGYGYDYYDGRGYYGPY